MLSIRVFALSKASIALLFSGFFRSLFFLSPCLLCSFCLLLRPDRSLFRLPFCRCVPILTRGLLKLDHSLDQPCRLPVDVNPAFLLFLVILTIHELCLNPQIHAAPLRKNLIEHPDQLISRILSQRGLLKLHPHDMLLRKGNLRSPEQIILQNAVMLQLIKNAVLIKLQKLFRRILARKLIALQNFQFYLRSAKQLLFQNALKMKKLLLMDQLSTYKIDPYEIFRPV